MKVCYFGIYNPEYSRNKILIDGLKENDVEVVQCVTSKKRFLKYFDLAKKHWKIRKSYDVMVVGYPGFQCVILAKIISRKPIIFNAFVSIYDSMVLDRAEVSEFSLKAGYFWILDKISFSLSDIIIFDTNEHIKFISSTFKVSAEKLSRVFLGSDIKLFRPMEMQASSVFKVLFYGHYIPLQGIEYIVRAAKLLENETDITFEIIGGGKNKFNMINLANKLELKNIVFFDEVPISELSRMMSISDVCLGIFGKSEKTKRVIPNKVFDAVALKKPIITSDTPAIRELFSENELILTDLSNPNSIADAILWAKSNREKMIEMADRAYTVLTLSATPQIVGNKLKGIIQSLCIK